MKACFADRDAPTLGQHLGWGGAATPRWGPTPRESAEETTEQYVAQVRASLQPSSITLATKRLKGVCTRASHPAVTHEGALVTVVSWAFANDQVKLLCSALHAYEQAFGTIPERAAEMILACSASNGSPKMVAQMRQFDTTEDFTTSVMHRVLWPTGYAPSMVPLGRHGTMRSVADHEKLRVTRAAMRIKELGVNTRTAIASVYARAIANGDTDMVQMLHTNYYSVISELSGVLSRKVAIACAWAPPCVHKLAASMNPCLLDKANMIIYIICSVVDGNGVVTRGLRVNYPQYASMLPRLFAFANRHVSIAAARRAAGHPGHTELSMLFDELVDKDWPDYEVLSHIKRCSDLRCFQLTPP